MTEHEQAQVGPSWGQRLAGLDGLRGIALLAVILAHTIILLPGPAGYSAVLVKLTGLLVHGLTFFFVLSAFLLYRPYASAAIKGRVAPPTREFYRNRILRIWPAYLVILAIVGWGFGLAVTDNSIANSDRLGYLTDPLQIVLNILLLQGWVPSTAFTGLGVSWSLVTEAAFYALLPLLGLLAVRLARTRRGVVAALIPAFMFLIAGEAGRLITLSINDWVDIDFTSTWLAVFNRSIIGQGDLFGLGMITAVVIVSSDRASEAALRRLRIGAWSLLFLSGFVILAIGSGEIATPFMGLLFACGITVTQLPKRDRLSRTVVRIMEMPPARLAGEYSLSCYLWHYPVVWFLREHFHDQVIYNSTGHVLISYVIVVVPTVILGTITYHLVERPAMRRKHRTDVPAGTIKTVG